MAEIFADGTKRLNSVDISDFSIETNDSLSCQSGDLVGVATTEFDDKALELSETTIIAPDHQDIIQFDSIALKRGPICIAV